MNNEKQRIAIAEACGWKDVKHTKHEEVDIENRSIIHWSGLTGIPPEFTHYENRVRIPDYLNDLNAMHEAEKILTHDQAYSYTEFLWSQYPGHVLFNSYIWHATAAQRAEALLKALNLWKNA
jgi:hypothetical protein